MQFSDGEKLIAIMLADIMQGQSPDGEIDPDFVIRAITDGHLWALKWKYPGIFDMEEPDEDIVKETTDILTMCGYIEYSIKQLSEAERATIDPTDQEVFYGFDANNEPHYGVANMLIEHLDRWAEFKDRGLNSHMPTLGRYGRMKNAFDSVGFVHGGIPLQAIKEILDA